MKCIIVDDEPLAQEVLENYVGRIDELQLVKKCSNALQANQILHKEKVDLIFLDIQMPGMDGLAFLKSLQNHPAIVLTTAYPKYAVQSYDLNVTDYLLKPISFERFLKAVNKVIDAKKVSAEEMADKEFIFLKVDSKLVKVNYSDITYIEGMKDYLKIYVKEKLLVVHQTMKRIEELLPRNQFMRVHKSYIVSLKAVNSIVGNIVEISGKEIPIGANYKEQLINVVFKKDN